MKCPPQLAREMSACQRMKSWRDGSSSDFIRGNGADDEAAEIIGVSDRTMSVQEVILKAMAGKFHNALPFARPTAWSGIRRKVE